MLNLSKTLAKLSEMYYTTVPPLSHTEWAINYEKGYQNTFDWIIMTS